VYEAVHAHPDGDSTVARQARTAARFGYDGVVVRTREAEFDADAVAGEYGIDIVDAVEVAADDPGSAGGAVGNFRTDHTVVAVVGGSDALNRFAVEGDRVDVLVRPMRGDGDFNHVLAKAARDHDTHVEFDFGPVLRATGGHRVQAIRALTKLREICDHYDAPYVVSANARSHLQLRAPRELVAVGEEIGFSAEEVRAGLRAWGGIAARNRERRSDGFVAPGVRKGRYGGTEDDDAAGDGDAPDGE